MLKSMPKKVLLAHISLLVLNFLYALSYFVVKSVSPEHLHPNTFVMVRVIGATILFWLLGLFVGKQKLDIKDLLTLAFASIFGVIINQLSFFNGLVYTSPTSTAIIMTCTPLIALPMSLVMLGEKITRNKVLGVVLGFSGALYMILQDQRSDYAENPLVGNLLILLNATAFTFFLVYIKSLKKKYHLVTLLKWVFLFGAFGLIPFSLGGALEQDWSLSQSVIQSILYVILGITFLTFLLNMFALKHLSPNVVTAYIFLQPAITAVLSFFILGTSIGILEIVATGTIFVGVYFTSLRK